MDYEKSMGELFERVLKVINELQEINNEYANWDEWDKTKVIDSALDALKTGYEKEILIDIGYTTDQ